MIDIPGDEATLETIEGIRRLRLRVLIVDDNTIYRQSLRRNLEIAYAATVVEAESVRSALAALADVSEEAVFDLILMDVVMPVMSGIEACERIRAMGIHTPIVLMSAYGDAANRSRAAAMGVPFVAKPLGRRALELLLRERGRGPSA